MTFVIKKQIICKEKIFYRQVFSILGVTDGEMQLDMEAALHSNYE